MPYLLSAALVLVGLVLLVTVLVRMLREVRRTQIVFRAIHRSLRAESGMVRARSAALRVAVAQRRREPTVGTGRVVSAIHESQEDRRV